METKPETAGKEPKPPKKEGYGGGRRKEKKGTTGPEEENCPSQQALVLSLTNTQSWVSTASKIKE